MSARQIAISWACLLGTGALLLLGSSSTLAARVVLLAMLVGYVAWRVRPCRATGVLAIPFFTVAALLLCLLPRRRGSSLMDLLLGQGR